MRYASVLILLLAWSGCDSDKHDEHATDAGSEHAKHHSDASTSKSADAGTTSTSKDAATDKPSTSSLLERPNTLPRPPRTGLPPELIPPR